jgi:hypothetical protein
MTREYVLVHIILVYLFAISGSNNTLRFDLYLRKKRFQFKAKKTGKEAFDINLLTYYT